MTPLFIELSDGSLINANHVLHVKPSGSTKCVLETIVLADNQAQNGSWSPGGSGSVNSYTINNRVFFITEYSIQEWAARVNNAVALAQAVERAASGK